MWVLRIHFPAPLCSAGLCYPGIFAPMRAPTSLQARLFGRSYVTMNTGMVPGEISPGLHVRHFSIHSASIHPIESVPDSTASRPERSRSIAFTPVPQGTVPPPLEPGEDLWGDFAIIT